MQNQNVTQNNAMYHSNCHMSYEPEQYYIEGAKEGYEEDGDWDEESGTYYLIDLDQLRAICPADAEAAEKNGHKYFTLVYGDLIACDETGRNGIARAFWTE